MTDNSTRLPRHRLRVEALTDTMTLGPGEARHLHVLRLSAGDAVRVFDGRGAEALAEIAELDRKSTRLNSSHVSESRMPSSA